MNSQVSLIVPAFNEEANVGPLVDMIRRSLGPLALPYEVVFVDDGSTDGTFARLEELAARDLRLVVIKLRRNSGQTAAMAAGIEHARGDVLVTLDADLQNDPADIPMLLEKLAEGYDLVVGWRIARQDALLSRKLPSTAANWLISKLTGLPIRDNGCSLKAYRADFIKRVPLYSDMHRFIPAMAIPLGVRIAQVGVRHHARRFGQSKYGISRIYKVVVDLLVIKSVIAFSRRPLAFFAGAGGLAALIAAASGLIALRDALWAPGQTTVVLSAISMLFGALTLFLVSAGIVVSLIHQRGSGHGRPRALTVQARSFSTPSGTF